MSAPVSASGAGPRAVPASAEGTAQPSCLPGQVNDLGVGRLCKTNADCQGFKASMCSFAKGPDRPQMCIIHCDADEQCGPGAMCGLVRGWIRACFPARCDEFRYEPSKVRPVKGTPARHQGAVVHDAGIAFSAGGWGKRCAEAAACEGLDAGHCNRVIYPAGVSICEHECRDDTECGADAYCSYEATRGFSLCLPRSPEPAHREVLVKPANLDACKVEGTVVDFSRNAMAVGKPCAADTDCNLSDGRRADGVVCGRSLPGPRQTDSCTRPCSADSDCGQNGLCIDLLRGVAGSSGPARYCVPGCWAI